MLIDRKMLHQFDWLLLGVAVLLPLVGLIVLYSAGFQPEARTLNFLSLPIRVHSVPFARQSFFLLVGAFVMGTTIMLPAIWWQKVSYLFYICVVLLLIGVLTGGQNIQGARRWLSLGPLQFQPSELAKLAVILLLARYCTSHPPGRGGYSLWQLMVPAILVSLPVALIVLQPDLGTALSVCAIGGAMLLFVGVRLYSLAALFAMAMGAIYPLWEFVLKAYQKRRVLALLDPGADPQGSGYQIIQSKIAVGSGSLFGKGFLQGTQNQLEFLPEHTTDFIFSVLAEEWGFVGAAFVLLLYLFLLYRILRATAKSRELFPSLVTFGIAAMLFVHVVVNVGMVVGLLPVVGLPLPLFSYGGSASVVTMFMMGIVLGIAMRRGYGRVGGEIRHK